MSDPFVHLRQAGLITVAPPIDDAPKKRGPKVRPVPTQIALAIAEYKKQKSLAAICTEFGVNRNTLAVYLYGDKHENKRPK